MTSLRAVSWERAQKNKAFYLINDFSAVIIPLDRPKREVSRHGCGAFALAKHLQAQEGRKNERTTAIGSHKVLRLSSQSKTHKILV